jgi:hypothetical protein
MELPAASLRAELKKAKPNLELVVAIANEAACSLEVVAQGISQRFSEWDDLSFLWWKFKQSVCISLQSG